MIGPDVVGMVEMGGIAPPSGQISRHLRYRHGPFRMRRARINGQGARAVRGRLSLRRVCEPSESDSKDDAPIRFVESRDGGTGSQLTREPWPAKTRGTPKRSRPSRGKQRWLLLDSEEICERFHARPAGVERAVRRNVVIPVIRRLRRVGRGEPSVPDRVP